MYASPILEVDQRDHNQSNRRSVISPSAWVILIRVYVVRFKVLSAADADCHLFRTEIGQDKADYTLRIGTGHIEASRPVPISALLRKPYESSGADQTWQAATDQTEPAAADRFLS